MGRGIVLVGLVLATTLVTGAAAAQDWLVSVTVRGGRLHVEERDHVRRGSLHVHGRDARRERHVRARRGVGIVVLPVVLVPRETSACLHVQLLSTLAAIDPEAGGKTDDFASAAALACGPLHAALERWPSGERTRSLGGAWYYPGGERASAPTGTLYYPSGERARSSTGTWYYPGGERARRRDGTWYTPASERLGRALGTHRRGPLVTAHVLAQLWAARPR